MQQLFIGWNCRRKGDQENIGRFTGDCKLPCKIRDQAEIGCQEVGKYGFYYMRITRKMAGVMCMVLHYTSTTARRKTEKNPVYRTTRFSLKSMERRIRMYILCSFYASI